MTGRLSGLTFNKDGTQNITVTVDSDFSSEYEELKEKDITVDIKKYSKRRSLDANAMAWSLIDRIAAKTKIKKSEVYRNTIREIGGVSTIVCVKDIAVDSLCNSWASHGIGWQFEKSKSKIPGCTNVTLWYGSSVYDTKQMSDLIDSLIQDAESLGIPTITCEERDRLIEQWGQKKEKEK